MGSQSHRLSYRTACEGNVSWCPSTQSSRSDVSVTRGLRSGREIDMANVNDFVRVLEASDGGTGNPADTFWQFFVGAQAVTTRNPLLAATMKLAVETEAKVNVTFDPAGGNTMSQARIEYRYICEEQQITRCNPGPEPGPAQKICEGRRYAPCGSGAPD